MADWLVVVDAQRVFAQPDSPWYTPGFEAAADGARRLATVFGPRTVLTRFVPPPEPAGAWADYYERWRFALEPGAQPLWALVEPWTGASSVDFTTLSKWGPPLIAVVGEAPTLVLCGVSTDCCVWPPRSRRSTPERAYGSSPTRARRSPHCIAPPWTS